MDEGDLPLKKSLLILSHEVVGIVNQAGLRVPVDVFPFDELPDVLIKVKHGKINGNVVIQISEYR